MCCALAAALSSKAYLSLDISVSHNVFYIIPLYSDKVIWLWFYPRLRLNAALRSLTKYI